MVPDKKKRFTEIDSLRGFAALGVLLFHFSLANNILLKYFKYGVTGVDLFFMISGFVIFMSVSSAKRLEDFWFSRFNRLFPSYWLSIAIALVSYYFLTSFIFNKPVGYYLGNILMLQPIFKAGNLVDAYWTLYVELTFYCFISVAYKCKLFNKIELIIWIGLLLMLIINGIYLLDIKSEKYTRFFIMSRSVAPLISFFSFFAAGMVYYLIFTKGYSFNRVLLLVTSFFITILIHNISGRSNFFIGVAESIVCLLVYNAMFILILFKKAKFLSIKWFIFLGSISYPLYLVHESIGVNLNAYLSKYVNNYIALIAGVATSFILAIIMTYGFEKYVHKWLKRKYYITKGAR